MQIKKDISYCHCRIRHGSGRQRYKRQGGTTPDSGAAAEVAEHDMNVYGANYTDGDKFEGLTRKIGFDRMIPPHALWRCVTTRPRTSSSRLKSSMWTWAMRTLLPDSPTGAKNVLRVKSAFKSFKQETNLSVITEDGSYYTFNVKFAKEPLLLSIEMTDFLHDGEAVNRPNNAQEIYLENSVRSRRCL